MTSHSNLAEKMMNIQNNKASHQCAYIMIAILLLAFCVLKVLRGTVESLQAGGIWNYISLLYYPLFIFAILRGNHNVRVRMVFLAPLLYVFCVLFSVLCTTNIQLNVSTIYSLLMIPYFFLVFSVFYCYSDGSKSGNKIIVIAYLFCLAINMYSIIKYQFLGASRPLASDIYFSLGLFPFMLQLTKNKSAKVFFSIAEFFAVFLANKRTALIAFVIALIAFLLIDEGTNGKKRLIRMIKILIVLTIGITVFYIISQYIDDKFNLNIYMRLFRMQEDGGSGREQIYESVWDAFCNSPFFFKLLGHGMNTAGMIGGAGQAHDDFLEILYDYGIPAFAFSVLYYISLIGEALKMIKRRSPYAAAFSASIIIGLLLSLFSYFLIYYTYVTCIVTFWGYALAMEKHRLKLSGKEGSNEYS